MYPNVEPVYYSLYLFPRYLELMRALESIYWLEPAGSHGVWGLDDYHFLPFLFGSAQLCSHQHLRPSSIHNPDLITELSKDYLYFDAIRVINSLKTGVTLRWHSPMLDDISAVKTWQKVNEGMLKMYRVEVLGKQPIMQHFLFGSVLVFNGSDKPNPAGSATEEEIHPAEHVHASGSVGRGDCCGNPIPSAFAAGKQDKRLFPVD